MYRIWCVCGVTFLSYFILQSWNSISRLVFIARPRTQNITSVWITCAETVLGTFFKGRKSTKKSKTCKCNARASPHLFVFFVSVGFFFALAIFFAGCFIHSKAMPQMKRQTYLKIFVRNIRHTWKSLYIKYNTLESICIICIVICLEMTCVCSVCLMCCVWIVLHVVYGILTFLWRKPCLKWHTNCIFWRFSLDNNSVCHSKKAKQEIILKNRPKKIHENYPPKNPHSYIPRFLGM